jgi:hypothetical protein
MIHEFFRIEVDNEGDPLPQEKRNNFKLFA